jgi:hypothetical protein
MSSRTSGVGDSAVGDSAVGDSGVGDSGVGDWAVGDWALADWALADWALGRASVRHALGAFALVLALALGCVGTAAPIAVAQARGSESEADALFAEGRDAYDRGDVGEALALFRQAYAQSGSPVAHLYIARSLRDLDDRVAAADEYARVAATAASDAGSRYERVRQAALAELAELASSLARVRAGAGDDALQATLDDRSLTAGEWTYVAPGSHALVVRDAQGRVCSRVELALVAGQERDAELVCPATSDASSDSHEHRDVAGGPTRDVALTIAGGVSLGVGVLGVLAGGSLQIAAQLRHDELAEACAATCPLGAAERAAEGQSFEQIGSVLLVIGAVALASGIVGLVLGLSGGGGSQRIAVDARGLGLRF